MSAGTLGHHGLLFLGYTPTQPNFELRKGRLKPIVTIVTFLNVDTNTTKYRNPQQNIKTYSHLGYLFLA